MCSKVDRVFIITGLRIQALRMVNAQDFTYSKGYLGLLSTLGASLGIIFCCVPSVFVLCLKLWGAYRARARASMAVHIDEEDPAAAAKSPDEPSLEMADFSPPQTHDTKAPWDRPYLLWAAYFKGRSQVVHTYPAAASRSPHDNSLPTNEEDAPQTHDRSARWSMDGCVACVEPPPKGGLQRHRTF